LADGCIRLAREPNLQSLVSAKDRCPACGSSLEGGWHLVGADRLHGGQGRFEVRRCGSCGTGVTFPQGTADDLARFYPAEYGAYVSTSGAITGMISRMIVSTQTRRALSQPPLAAISRLPRGQVLDVGCGRGDLAAAFTALGWHAVGIDPSAAACAAAAAKGVETHAGTLATVELDANAYDAAYFQHSLEHSDDIGRDLEIVAAALRPRGTLAITVPNFGSWQLRCFGDRWYHLDLPRHRVHFTEAGLTMALVRAGFKIKSVSTSTSTVGFPGTLQYAVFGRCLFPSGLPLRIATGLCLLQLPLARLLDHRRGGDQLHAVAQVRK
jgi:SAM-dependent methyltransferase